jgi:hypothetical protein
MDAAAHGGQVVTNLELLRKLAMGWVAQQSEEQQQQQQQPQLRTTASLGSEPVGSSFWQQQQQQDGQQTLLTTRGSIPSIAEGQQLHVAWQQQQQQQQQSRRRSEDSTDLSSQAVAPRSLSWSPAQLPAPAAQRQWRVNGLGNKDSDICTAECGLQQQQYAAAAAAVSASSLDAVFALHLGQFRFKGSGEYEMVSLLHGALTGRTFPADPPRGKGERLGGQLGGAVRDLPAVHLTMPAELLAARQGLQVEQQQQFAHEEA